jgi:hypothetical protein
MDQRVRTGISLPLVHAIPRWKKLMARKFTGVEHASVGTTLTLQNAHVSVFSGLNVDRVYNARNRESVLMNSRLLASL